MALDAYNRKEERLKIYLMIINKILFKKSTKYKESRSKQIIRKINQIESRYNEEDQQQQKVSHFKRLVIQINLWQNLSSQRDKAQVIVTKFLSKI